MFALVSDLIFSTKISSTAAALGAKVAVIRTLEKLDGRLASAADSIALIDLDAADVDAIEAIRRIVLSPHRPYVIAFVSHVRADLIDAARRAGADKVMARSAFVTKLPAILSDAARREGVESNSKGGPP